MTRTLIILSFHKTHEFYYGNGLNKCGADYIDELKPQLNEPMVNVRQRILNTGYSLNGAGFDYDTPIGDCLLVWLDSIHIIYSDPTGLRVEQIETLRKHQ